MRSASSEVNGKITNKQVLFAVTAVSLALLVLASSTIALPVSADSSHRTKVTFTVYYYNYNTDRYYRASGWPVKACTSVNCAVGHTNHRGLVAFTAAAGERVAIGFDSPVNGGVCYAIVFSHWPGSNSHYIVHIHNSNPNCW
jgi:hypothetical protein